MNDNPSATASPVPLIPLRRGSEMAAEVERLMHRPEAAGQGTLAYLLDCALMEARRVADQERRDWAERDADARDLWGPAGP